MRNLQRPNTSSVKTDDQLIHEHVCVGLDGLNSYSAFSTKGLLKIVNRDIDPQARGFHRDHRFILATRFTKDELLDELVSRYQPSSFVPVFAKALFDPRYEKSIEELTNVYPEYCAKVLRSKVAIEKWLDDRDYKVEDIKGDILIELFHDLHNIIKDREILDYVRVTGIPYTITNNKGKVYKKLWYSPLFNKSLGRYGKGNIWTSFLSSIKDVDRNSWESAIFGVPHKGVMGDYPLFQFDLKNWGGSREGKSENGYGIRGYGISTGEPSIGCAADVIMVIESLTFFRGYVGERYAQRSNSKTSEDPSITKKPLFTLCVRNNAPGFHTALWSEMSTSQSNSKLLGVEEIFVPIWKTPLTFKQARERLSQTAELPVETFLNSSKDLMSHLSQHAAQAGIDSFMRFSCVGRGGVGMSQLQFLIPIEEFEPHKSRRNNIITPLMPLYTECMFKIGKDKLPNGLKKAAEAFVESVNDFSISKATSREIMYSILDLIERLKITDTNYHSGRLSSEYFDVNSRDRLILPDWWSDVVGSKNSSAEFRIGKSIARNKQYCTLGDVCELLEDKLDLNLINTYSQFLAFVEPVSNDIEQVTDGSIWLPADYAATYKLMCYKKYDFKNEKNAWQFLMELGDCYAALCVVLDTLYSKSLLKDYVYPFASSNQDNLRLALQIPLSTKDSQRVRRYLN